MPTFIRNFLDHRLTSDSRRILLVIAAIVVLLWLESWLPAAIGQPQFSPLLNSLSMVMGSLVAGHIMCRMIMPSVDLQELVGLAKGGSVSAAIAAVGVLAFRVSPLFAAIALMR